uniref:tRNA wybutosine-synthesizing protein 4 n=1 Tax=Sinocyclocheilus grahami TaxID=75366 RepID=A0A672KR60_SINGR
AQGYFHDDFLRHFVCKVSRRLITVFSMPQNPIMSLGAGFDSLYFRLHAEGALGGVTVFEIDFPEVARRKATLINSNTCLKDTLPDWETVSNQSGHYNLIGVDVRKEQEVEATLSRAGLQWDGASSIFLTCVLVIFSRSDAVIGWAAKLVMQNHFLRLNSTIHALKQYPDTVTQTERFIQKGWEKCVCLDMNQFYFDLLPEDERQRVEGLEPFDEFEVRKPHSQQRPLNHPRITTESDLMPDPRPVFIFMITGMAPEMFSLLHPYSLQRLCDQSSPSHKDPVLGDAHFLCLEDKHWTEITVVGAFPETRHSHSACPYGGGLVIFGGLGKGSRPLGDAFYLRPTSSGFCWETKNLHPPPVPRYSHSAHVINEKLVVVGGVWLQADGVPGVAVINLNTGSCVAIQLDTVSYSLLDSEGSEMVLLGGGGNCFSFGTHLNLYPVTVDLRPILCYSY